MGRVRLTAAERSRQMVAAAVTAFSANGYAGTTTEDVAKVANVSQPYVIRLFGTKQRLFIAGFERAADRIEEAFREAGTEMTEMESAYDRLLAERELLGMLLHGFAASSEPAIGEVVRERFGRIYRLVEESTGASADEVQAFLATGMLVTVLAAIRVDGPDAVPPSPWMRELLGSIRPEHRAGEPS